MARRSLRNPRWLRAVRYRLAGDAAYTAVRAADLELIVPTRDRLGERLFVNQKRSDFRVLPRAVELLGEPHGTFVDVGANIGWFSVLAGTLLRTSGAVHSIEANVENCVLLQRSIADNGLTERVTVHPVAASDRTTTLVLQRQAGTNGLVNDDAQAVAQVGAHPVQALRLDDLLADLDRVDLVKIDIEGSELRAVVGMADLLRGHHPHVLMEFSPDLLRRVSGCEPSELVDVLRSYGYQEARWLRPGEPPAPVNFDTGSLGEAMAATTSDHLDLHLLP